MRSDAGSKRSRCKKTAFMKKIFFIIFFIPLLFSFHLQAQDSTRTGLLYGQNHSYYLTAPLGWIIDNTSGREEGFTAVFYPEGSSWADAETVMYATYVNYDSTKKETVKDIITSDSVQFQQAAPQLRVKRLSPIQIGKDKKAIIYSYSSEGNYETVAYLGEKKGVIVIVLSSKNKNGPVNYNRSFESLVKSYRFLTDKVNIK
jgi:hypothetical protein